MMGVGAGRVSKTWLYRLRQEWLESGSSGQSPRSKWERRPKRKKDMNAPTIGYAGNNIAYPYLYNSPAASWTGAVYNNSSDSDASAICPIVRDQSVSSNGWTSLDVTVLNLSTNEQLCCNARTSNYDDYQFDYKQLCTGNTNWKMMSFPAAGIPAGGYMFLECTIPKKAAKGYPSGIASFDVTEAAP